MRPSAICKKVRRKDGESLPNLNCVFLVVCCLLIMLFPFLVANVVSTLVPVFALLISACLAETTVFIIKPIAKSIFCVSWCKSHVLNQFCCVVAFVYSL